MKPYAKLIIALAILTMFFINSCSNGHTVPISTEITPTFPPFPTIDPRPTNTPPPTYTPLPVVVEPGLASNYPCKPPCWWELTPGQSTLSETKKVIERLNTEEWVDRIRDGSSVGGGYTIHPLPGMAGSIHVTMEDEIVKKISGRVLFYHSVEKVVEEFGSPEGLYVVNPGGSACSSCQTWQPPADPLVPAIVRLPVYLLYPQQGLLFLAESPGNGAGCICPEMKINWFCYYEPLSISEAMQNDYLANLCRDTLKGVTEEDLNEWQGFGAGY